MNQTIRKLILTSLFFLNWIPVANSDTSSCHEVPQGVGTIGHDSVQLNPVVNGLEAPWAIGFLPNGNYLVTERPGRVRIVQNQVLIPTPVATLPVSQEGGEGGLLGLAIDPLFDSNRFIYLYSTVSENRDTFNRVERYQLAPDEKSIQFDKLILDKIPGGSLHNGGRLHFGPDGFLYIGTGDARNSANSQNLSTPAGKLLRVTRDGDIPSDNPTPGNPVYLSGIRNVQAFDWIDPQTILLADHGPTGELGRFGHDEINIVKKGDNLGWPDIWGCEQGSNQITPQWVWDQAVPPGGGAIYQGSEIPSWKGNFIMASLGAQALIRVILDSGQPPRVQSTEVYFEGSSPNGFGRLREVIRGPDGELYITTSNCDSRGDCPPEKDMILKLGPKP